MTETAVQWQAVILSKRGREMGRFDIDDIRSYVASLDTAVVGMLRVPLWKKIGPRVWVDADGVRTVLEPVYA
jgi:hypothetical protein